MESKKNIFGITVLIIILLIFVVGGYFLMEYLTNENTNKEVKNEEKKDEVSDLRIDKSKDYIYYENGVHIIEAEEINFEDVIINFNTLTGINNTLKNEMNMIRNSIVYTKDIQLQDGVTNENEEGIYSLKYREYEDYAFGDYVSLVVKDYEYDIVNLSKPIDLESYVINKKTGMRVDSATLLTEYNLTMDELKGYVKKRLEDTQVLNEGTLVIDIDRTLNEFNIFAIYVNKNGNLEVTFVVKSNESDYNDSVEIIKEEE